MAQADDPNPYRFGSGDPVPGMPKAPKPMKAPKVPAAGKKPVQWGCLIPALIVIVLAAVVIVSLAVGGSSGAKYTATIEGINPADPAEVNVGIHVVNTGTGSGAPTCTINLSSPGGAYTGFDGLTASQSIPKGGEATYQATITITNEGAQFVTLGASTVSCD